MEIDEPFLEFGYCTQSISGFARGTFTVQKTMETFILFDFLVFVTYWNRCFIHRS
jgi:hypothetical protein